MDEDTLSGEDGAIQCGLIQADIPVWGQKSPIGLRDILEDEYIICIRCTHVRKVEQDMISRQTSEEQDITGT